MQPCIARPSVSLDCAARGYRAPDSLFEALSRSVRYSFQPNPANPGAVEFRRDYDQGLSRRTTSSLAGLRSAYIGLVYLYRTRKLIASWSNHRSPELVKPCPSREITPQTQDLLEAQCACPGFLTGYPPHRAEPHAQWLARVLEYGARRYRYLIGTRRAHQQAPASLPEFAATTTRANDTVRPTQLREIRTACLFRREPRLKLSECLGVVFHTSTYYALRLLEATEYPG